MGEPNAEMDPEAERALALAGELRVVLGNMRRRLREQAHPGDLSWSQMSVLGRLERDGPTTVTVLAKAEGVRPQSMGATVSVMQEAGLVVGEPDPSDGRQTVLSLTDSCRELVRANRAARVDWLFRAIRSNLSAREQETLAKGVELLRRLVDAREVR
ncbi:MAG TPA: MarR family transcriptional regulator [Fibrobacteria bacterium]|nr:MarR family transcriptional regulator [Fibrobacteria bacterium]